MCSAILRAQGRRHRLEETLPLRALTALEYLSANEEIDRVRLLRALNALLEWQREHARVVSQPPQVCLRACKPRAVDARLLARADADDRAPIGVRDTVRLCVLERQGGDDEVSQSLVRQLRSTDKRAGCLEKGRAAHRLVFGDDVLEKLSVDLCVVAPLLHVNAVDLSCLYFCGHVGRIDLRDLSIPRGT